MTSPSTRTSNVQPAPLKPVSRTTMIDGPVVLGIGVGIVAQPISAASKLSTNRFVNFIMCRFLELCSVAELSNIFILGYDFVDDDTLLLLFILICPMCDCLRVRVICFLDVVGVAVANYM